MWLPSQYGLFLDWPQRHSTNSCPRFSVCPVPEMISRGPTIFSGPFFRSTTSTGPLRTASAAESVAAGSPLAVNPAAACEPSQNGLCFDWPQRQSVAR